MTVRYLPMILSGLFTLQCIAADDPVFSGPQVGEPLPPFVAQQLIENEGEDFDFVQQADGGPVLLVFFHELTRPGFGLTNTITRYATSRKETPIQSCVIFLTDDPTETRQWSKNVVKHLTKNVVYGSSVEGKEGPGSYGLNRNIKLTILVGNQGKVTGNFAIGQPQLEVDGPKILKAITDVTGGGKVPTIAELGGNRYRGRMREMQDRGGRSKDAKLTSLIRGVINKQATPVEVAEAAKKVEAYITENEAAKKEFSRIVTTVVDSGKLSNYGTLAAQEVLKRWRKEHGVKSDK